MTLLSRLGCALLMLGPLGGCDDPIDDTHEGIAVGNPGVVAMSLAASPDFEVTLAAMTPQWVGFAACEGADRVAYPGAADLALAPLSVSFPPGDWCGVAVRFAAGARLEATWDDGVDSATVVADLDIGELELQAVDGGLTVDEETALALELASPGWLDPDALGLSGGQELVIGPGDALHDALVAALAGESALFDDLDASGLVDLPERDAGAVALPGDISFNPDVAAGVSSEGDSGSGCACDVGPEAGPGPGILALMALLLALRRARPARREPGVLA